MTTGKFSEAFPNKSTINGTLIFTADDGKTLFDMVWTRKRQAGVAGQPLRERWAKIGTPIEPIPAEVKKLDGFVGEWDSKFIQRPSVISPNGGTEKRHDDGHGGFWMAVSCSAQQKLATTNHIGSWATTQTRTITDTFASPTLV